MIDLIKKIPKDQRSEAFDTIKDLYFENSDDDLRTGPDTEESSSEGDSGDSSEGDSGDSSEGDSDNSESSEE